MGIAVGIDLGTSNTVVSAIVDGRAQVLADPDGNRVQPSVVAFDGKRVTVGHRAQEVRRRNPEYVVYSVKRLIGRRFRSPEIERIRRMVSWGVASGPSGDARVRVQGRVYSAEEVSAHILRHMRRIAEQATGQYVESAVITVPAYFNDHQRQATRDAAEIAGLECLRIVNEPTAAALSHGFDKGARHHLAVFDLGGGTFDVSVLKIDGDVFEVVSTAGDTFLGGDDFDAAIAEFLVSRLKLVHGVDIDQTHGGRARLMAAAERAKCLLSSQPEVIIEENDIGLDNNGQSVDLNLRLNRKIAADLVMPLIQRCFVVCDDAMAQAGLRASQVDSVLMVGGMTRFPLVREAVGSYFDKEPVVSVNPDEVVAQGAAIQARNLSTFQADPGAVLLDVTSQTLGLRTIGGFMDPLIPRNTPIPHEICKNYHTTQDGQTQVRVQIYQGPARQAIQNHLLGEFVLTGLRAAPRGDVRIQITFAIDADGIVKVSAEDTESGNQVDMMVRASSRMSEIERNQLREGGETQRSEESRPPEEAQGADPFADGELEVATENDGMGLIDDETEEDDDDLDLSDDWMEST
jgi:molecular chaperone DnaK